MANLILDHRWSRLHAHAIFPVVNVNIRLYLLLKKHRANTAREENELLTLLTLNQAVSSNYNNILELRVLALVALRSHKNERVLLPHAFGAAFIHD